MYAVQTQINVRFCHIFMRNMHLTFSTSKDKIDDVYAYLQAYFKIDYDREINKYFGIDLDHRPYGSINIRHQDLNQRIINMIPGMENSNANTTPAVKPLLTKN